MLTKTIAYTDYNGVSRIEKHHFHLSKAEIMELELGTAGGFIDTVKTAIDSHDQPLLFKTFKMLLQKSYGVKSEDGRRHIKSDEILAEFVQTEAYSKLFMELVSDAKVATEFFNGIMPADMQEAAANARKEGKLPEIPSATK